MKWIGVAAHIPLLSKPSINFHWEQGGDNSQQIEVAGNEGNRKPWSPKPERKKKNSVTLLPLFGVATSIATSDTEMVNHKSRFCNPSRVSDWFPLHHDYNDHSTWLKSFRKLSFTRSKSKYGKWNEMIRAKSGGTASLLDQIMKWRDPSCLTNTKCLFSTFFSPHRIDSKII